MMAAETFHLQDRDLALLRGLFESGVMKATHIAVLCFSGSKETLFSSPVLASVQSRRADEEHDVREEFSPAPPDLEA